LERLEPYGAGNKEPLIMLRNVRLIKPTMVGVGHVRCVLLSDNGGSLKAMAFRVGDNDIGQAMLTAKGDYFDVIGVLRRDKWQGRNETQFIIDDIRLVG